MHLTDFPATPADWLDPALAAKWEQVRRARRVVTGALEIERRDKRIGASLEAAPVVHVADAALRAALGGVDFADVCITSDLTLTDAPAPDGRLRLDDVPGVAVVPRLADGAKCARCWKILPDVGAHAHARRLRALRRRARLTVLVLHIGLPKTGTTFLQHRVFGQTPGLAFVHRQRRPARGGGLRAASATSRRATPARRGLASPAPGRRGCARSAGRRRRFVVSDENISVKAEGFWTGGGAGPERLAGRLAALRPTCREAGPLRVIIGIRRQDQWLASRYAESSKHFPAFGQGDFDRRMAAIAAARRSPGRSAGSTTRGRARRSSRRSAPRTFCGAAGAAGGGAEATLAAIGGFIGVDPGAAARHAGAAPQRACEGENIWRLRRDRAPLEAGPGASGRDPRALRGVEPRARRAHAARLRA